MLSPWTITQWDKAVGLRVEESLCGLTAEWVEMLPQERRKGEMPLRISRHESKICVQKEKPCSC